MSFYVLVPGIHCVFASCRKTESYGANSRFSSSGPLAGLGGGRTQASSDVLPRIVSDRATNCSAGKWRRETKDNMDKEES
ncbi:hypothetical protein PISMIDRAFT_680382 [Pisolithus microcarpus 441]|uniref:Unplaced genomic scaffold scaffold_56, whole genome shotgun sequence n=1 Tax=Pisolithus microcarpus 441 TaxID=765257 RepID=A0A0C9Z001_9AGAM|nr:hypothetical protein PISMIDRAFT_680382 [Pisolithus microcarpus 441]